MVDATCRSPLMKAVLWRAIYRHGSGHFRDDNFGIHGTLLRQHRYDYLDFVINLSWMYIHDKKRDLLWQTRIITEVYFFVVMVDTHDNVSWALLKLFQLCSCFAAAFICTGGQFWRLVYVICCFVPYICTSGELWCPVDVICVIAVIRLALVSFLFISLLSCLVVCL